MEGRTLRTRMVVLPAIGSTVYVHPDGDGDPWEATLLAFTAHGKFQVRSTRPGATTVQTVDRISVAS